VLLKDAAARRKLTDAALQTMNTLCGALDRTVSALDPYLMHLRLEQRSEHA
jgi:hypothetical protein